MDTYEERMRIVAAGITLDLTRLLTMAREADEKLAALSLDLETERERLAALQSHRLATEGVTR